MTKQFLIKSVSILSLAVSLSAVTANEFSGEISLQGHYFKDEGESPEQKKKTDVALGIQPKYKHKWDNGHKKITFTAFYRWDQQDKERTHADIRQLEFGSSLGE